MRLAYLSLAHVGNTRKVPRVLSNEERYGAFLATREHLIGNGYFRFTPARQSTAPLPVAGGAGIYEPDPPTHEEVAEAYRLKYGT